MHPTGMHTCFDNFSGQKREMEKILIREGSGHYCCKGKNSPVKIFKFDLNFQSYFVGAMCHTLAVLIEKIGRVETTC